MTNPTVLLIVPPNVPPRDLASSGNYQTVHLASVPMGVLSIASYSRAHVGGEWTILDMNLHLDVISRCGGALKWHILADAMKGKVPDVVGLSCIFNAQAGYLGPIAAAARLLWPKAVIVAGGGFPTNMPEDARRLSPELNTIITGEGERGILQMLYLMGEGYRASGLMKPAVIENLDDIPPLAYDLIDMDRYQDVTRSHAGGRTASIMTTRGCPYSCRFCSSSTVHGKRIRRHSPERVLSDVRGLIERYGIDTLLIEDDQFLGNRRHALEVLRLLAPLKLTIEYPNGLAVHCIDAEIAHAMAEAGARTATLAVESGCARVLREIMHKPWSDLSKVKRAVDLLHAEGMYVRAFFVIGNPGETLAEMEETGRFMREMSANWCAIMIATPIAGSEYHRICSERGWLATEDAAEYHYGHGTIRTPDFEPEQVERMRYRLNLDVNFVHNPDMAAGRYEAALRGFEDVLVRVPDHAFAHVYAGRALIATDRIAEGAMHMAQSNDVLHRSEIWRRWAQEFGLWSE